MRNIRQEQGKKSGWDRLKPWSAEPGGAMYQEPVQAKPVTAEELLNLMERKAQRQKEIDPLMAKYDAAKAGGYALNERDKLRLLALLLTDRLDGLGNYP